MIQHSPVTPGGVPMREGFHHPVNEVGRLVWPSCVMHSIQGRLMLGIVVAVGVGSLPYLSEGASSPAASAENTHPSGPRWQGAVSCSSIACHGADGPEGAKRSEYRTWLVHDKHSRAYAVLFDDRSKRIEMNLKRIKDPEAAHPETNSLCLKCHVDPHYADRPRNPGISLTDLLNDGVGCESCHGPAEKWLGPHVTLAWRQQSAQEKEEKFGLRQTKEVLGRGQACVVCHIGSGDLDVNHDLIAAGHPRLKFEYGNDLARMHKHWREADDKKRYPDFEARVWVTGQLLSAQTALELLASRAAAADKPWPEFAEYDCFACHHDLGAASWRQGRGYTNRQPGSLAWNSWYYALPAVLGAQSQNGTTVAKTLRGLQRAMEAPLPDRQQIGVEARQAVRHLGEWLEAEKNKPLDSVSLRALLATVARDRDNLAQGNWDGAVQLYLAITALDQALLDVDSAWKGQSLRGSLVRLYRHLRFPKDSDSPRGFDPRSCADELRSIQKQLGQ